jgi:7-carboxy-7-deazaguanine synthase
MKISEIFHSVQGEGTLAGVPSVFVRTSGCNLRCWWCDTPYASWNPEGRDLTLEQVVAEVASFPANHVVITGGEPMIFEEVVPLTHVFQDRGLHITIETAGTVYQPVQCDLMSISPKLANSTPSSENTPVHYQGGRFTSQHERLRYQPQVLKQLMTEYPYQLKFVLSAASDLQEIEQMLAALNADRSRVLLMPEATTQERLRERALWIAEECKQRNLRFGPRLHIDIWGDKRGV